MMLGAAGLAISLVVICISFSQAIDSNREPTIAAIVFIFIHDNAVTIRWLGVT